MENEKILRIDNSERWEKEEEFLLKFNDDIHVFAFCIIIYSDHYWTFYFHLIMKLTTSKACIKTLQMLRSHREKAFQEFWESSWSESEF